MARERERKQERESERDEMRDDESGVIYILLLIYTNSAADRMQLTL